MSGTGMTNDKPKSKEERMKDLVKSLQSIEEAMTPFKEQRTDLKKNYVDNSWLSKEEIKYTIKAMRMLKDEIDLDKIVDYYNKLKK